MEGDIGMKSEPHSVELCKEVGSASSSVSCCVFSSCDGNTLRSHHDQGNITWRCSPKAVWTNDEDNLLIELVKKDNGRQKWRKIAEEIPGRTDVVCYHRWVKYLNPEINKGPWTKEEDDHIMKYFEENVHMTWFKIANDLPGCSSIQCEERWDNHLDPAIMREAGSKEEESTLGMSTVPESVGTGIRGTGNQN